MCDSNGNNNSEDDDDDANDYTDSITAMDDYGSSSRGCSVERGRQPDQCNASLSELGCFRKGWISWQLLEFPSLITT